MSNVDVSRVALLLNSTHVDVSYLGLALAPEATHVDVAYVGLQRLVEEEAVNVDISHISLTRGFESPVGTGGIRVRANDAWQPYTLKVRFNGQWL